MISYQAMFVLYVLVLASLSLTQTEGFVAPLIHRSSPESPFYEPSVSEEDLMMENQRISIARMRHFEKKVSVVQTAIAPISGDVVIGYYIGTPPVQTYGVLDTSSSLTWIQCLPCVHCYKQTKADYFKTYKSSTYKKVSCKDEYCKIVPAPVVPMCTSDNVCVYELMYNNTAYSWGHLSSETFIIGRNLTGPRATLPNIYFGCGFNNGDPGHGGDVSGVVGLGLQNSLVHQMNETRFSYCYERRQQGGSIRFGVNALLLGDPTPIVPNIYHDYHLILEDIAVGLCEDFMYSTNISSDIFKLGNDSRMETGFVIDSGSSYSFLHYVAFDAVVNKIKQLLNQHQPYSTKGWDLCYNLDEDISLSLDAMPRIHFVLKNFTFSPPLENIWTDKNGSGDVCLAIQRADAPLSGLGLYTQSSFNIGFDLAKNLLWINTRKNVK